MTKFITAKLKKSDDQMNIEKYSVATDVTDRHIISKLIFPRIIIPKFTRLHHVKNVCNI